jgi:outer membrane receptor protein involved in Fe transport
MNARLTDRRFTPRRRLPWSALFLGLAAVTAPAFADPVSTDADAATAADPAPATPTELDAVTVRAKRLDKARNDLSPITGGSRYTYDEATIDRLPEGDATPLNQLLLQAPGVANDSYGQLHVRGDHADLQYRINGIILPEGISTFGQTLDTRFAKSISLLTGALPAQFGERTAGVIDITTKQRFNGGVIDLYGGSHDTVNPSVQGGYSKGDVSTFGSASFLSNTIGVEAPTDSYNAIHDRTTQGKAFGYGEYTLGDNTRLVGMAGFSNNRLEIPNNPGQTPDAGFLTAAGVPGFSSADLDERQFEKNLFAIGALQGVTDGGISYQLAGFERQSIINYSPDPTGDLVFNGVAAQIKRKSDTFGLQADASLPIGDTHTLRFGALGTLENDRADNSSTVFPTTDPQADGSCPTGTTPSDSGACLTGGLTTIVDNNPKNNNQLFAVYAQDQWDVSETVRLNYGLRYDHLDAYTRAQQLSPRLGVVWTASPSTSVHAGYARYFTPPSNELISSSSFVKFANTTNASAITENSPVEPERSHYFDIGAVQKLGSAFTVGLDSYYKYVRNLQDEGQFGQALIFAPFNYQQGHVYGLEFTSAFHEGDWNAYFNAAHSVAQATRVASGQFNFGQDELNYIQNHYVFLDHDQSLTMSAGLSYVLYGTTVGADANYGSGLRKDFANTGKLTPYTQVDLFATRDVHLPVVGQLGLRAAVLNVLDRQYELRDGSGIGVGAPQFGPRVAAYFGVSKAFGDIKG